MVICILFGVCWSPLVVMLLYIEYSDMFPWWWPQTEWLVYFVAYSNTAINPFIYAVMSENYKLSLKQLIRRLTGRPPNPSLPHLKYFDVRFETERSKPTTTASVAKREHILRMMKK